MPGINVTTTVQSGVSTALQAASGQFFLVGQFERGSAAAPTRLRGVADLEKYFGGRTSYSDAYDQLLTFFSEGGQQAIVARVLGATPTLGTITLVDRAGSPLNTLRIDAINAGAWSSNLTVQVADGPVANTFRIIVRLSGNVVEDYNNLTSPADAVAKFANSAFVKVVSLGSATAAPNNNPAVIAATALSAGTDDRGTIVASNYVAQLALFTEDFGDGSVAIPGQTGATIWDGLIAHALVFSRVALLGAAKTETSANLQTQAATLNSEYAGLFAPWVVVPTSASTTRTISPEGYVAAVRARAHQQVGPWRAPAGALAIANYLVGVDQVFTGPQSEDLDAAKVNIIRSFANSIRLYGWRSLSNDTENWTYLKDRDLLNRITYEAKFRLEKYIFEPIDPKGHLLAVVQSELVGLLDPISKANGLYSKYDVFGNQIDPGYKVNVGSDINSPSTAAQNKINALISVRVAPVGAWINLVITKISLLGSV